MSETKISRLHAPASPGARCEPEGAAAVDAWLRLMLANRFDTVISEALPPELLAALAETH